MSAAPNSEVLRLVDEFERAIDGDAWHGDPVLAILGRVTFEIANAKPAGVVHSIRDIVRHMSAWTNEVRRRLDGESAGTPKEGDWPPAAGKDEAAWRGVGDTLYVTLHGLARHHAYHAGQIAILSKF